VSLNQFMQTLANGLLLGCVYAAFALGLSLVLGILGLVNVAHSAILILAALVYWQLVNGVGIDPLLAIPLVVAAFFLAGTALESTIVRRIEREPNTTALLVFFGTMVAIESIAVLVWTTDTRTVRPAYLDTVWRFGQIGVPVSRVVTAALTLVLLGGLHLFLTRTLTGAAIRGMAQNRDVAAMVGIRVRRLGIWVFAAGTALAAFGGTVLALVLPFSPQEHVRWLAWAFLIVIVGGLGSMRNTLLAGLLVGLVEAFVGVLLPFQYVYFVVYTLLVVALLARREGLGGSQARTI
jgi:branched-chain amino acid transport system permease protein